MRLPSFPRTLGRTRRLLGALLTAHRLGRSGSTVLVHSGELVRDLPDWLATRLHCGPRKGRFRLPDRLTVLLVHDRPEETVMERSLRYLGIEDFLVARPAAGTRWLNALKVELGLEALRNHSRPTPYILYADSDDCVLRDDLGRAIEILERSGHDVLFSDTTYRDPRGHTPEVHDWADASCPPGTGPSRYLCAGVFIGRWEAVVELLEAARACLAVPRGMPPFRVTSAGAGGEVIGEARFPYGRSSDQRVLRCLQPQFHPRIGVDFAGQLAYRRPPPKRQVDRSAHQRPAGA